ncbi:MAG: hypothetical protein ACYSTQ_05375 [Planctomycetota bacterium]|jgi:hypothetical protein
MRKLIIPVLTFIILAAPQTCSAGMWMTSDDWFYADSFKMPKDPYEAEELMDQVSREEATMRESYVRGVIDTLLLLSTTKTDNKEMLDGMMNLSIEDVSVLVTKIYKEQPQYRKKPVIFVLGYVMPHFRTRMGKPQEEKLKGKEKPTAHESKSGDFMK